ncbi:MAG: Crp/Fnr family transcriptional regulator [Candidatus Chryseobacterium colombiense]|nr:Crp/Fnr family transcriptional regulator [Chryseobacterium sp.]WEK70490.1 MAG: Crp/Fnr family transcriptional regulator [Chryseobacterium sp.]
MKTKSCMDIEESLLYSFGAETKNFKKGEMIFKEGDQVLYYFQIVEGKIKLNNYNDEGKEFIHNVLGKNQSFGDNLIFLDKQYHMNATCLSPTEVIRLPKNKFLQLLEKYPDISIEMNHCLSQRLYYKMVMIQNMASSNPSIRLKGLLNYLKSYHNEDCQHCFSVELTRQQIANLVGLRVETVIRALKKMEKEGDIKINNRKILY